MKKVLSLTVAFLLLLSAALPAFAHASDQISSYSITIVPRGSGRVEVTVNVIGTHRQMTRIGFPGIILYERIGGSWSSVAIHSAKYNPTVPAGSHSFVFTYQGVAGRQYYAYSSFFARDTHGSDTREADSPMITAT
jgi:hypothetical protein